MFESLPHVSDEVVFATMVAVALALSKSRLGWPLKWAETFYHEFSHGMVCVLTGGKIQKIELKFNGAGCCTTRGGWRIPILLAGYMGASLWGGALYMIGWLLSGPGGVAWVRVELAILAVVFLFWVRDWRTVVIMLILAGIYASAMLMPDSKWLPLLLQFMGIYVMLNAIRAPLFLIDGQHVGDGAALADIFKILPEGFWIVLWWVFALLVMFTCMILTLPDFARWMRPVLAWAGL